MTKTKTKSLNIAKLLAILCPLVYFASYLTRKDYSIVLEAIIQSEHIGKDVAGFVETLSLISYGAGQVISGILGDRFKPQKMITTGLAATVAINIAMPFCPSSLRAVVWFLNGFAQSMLWPPMVRILAATMDKRMYDDTCVNTNIAGISGTVLIYLSSSLLWIGAFKDWRLTFFADAAISAVILAVWIVSFRKIDPDGSLFKIEKKKEFLQSHRIHIYRPKAKKATGKKKSVKKNKKRIAAMYAVNLSDSANNKTKLSIKLLLGSGFIFIALGIILQGMLRDGITDWVPSFIADTFNLQSDKAILKSVALPILGVISLKIIGFINNKFVKEEVRAAGVTFAVGTACCAALLALYTKNQYVTLFASSVIVGTMHAVNLFLVSIVPSKFAKYGLVSTMSGIINSLTYVGSAAAIYGFGFISEHFGWNACVISWVVVAALGTISCFIAVPAWKKFKAR